MARGGRCSRLAGRFMARHHAKRLNNHCYRGRGHYRYDLYRYRVSAPVVAARCRVVIRRVDPGGKLDCKRSALNVVGRVVFGSEGGGVSDRKVCLFRIKRPEFTAHRRVPPILSSGSPYSPVHWSRVKRFFSSEYEHVVQTPTDRRRRKHLAYGGQDGLKKRKKSWSDSDNRASFISLTLLPKSVPEGRKTTGLKPSSPKELYGAQALLPQKTV